ncbi:sulfotransferase family 2 domain-containing protein [Seonamhaeicola maritimus]|uniref:sulfotransferase family 2 domain-containing protein n=1 Tax=Seonamhaeicola maritimus TaxID=2591822 RepID=UPI002495054D|nr:sulfotransferase family 2 domain-containing protein [Seonamhaeicola maritimus]
MKRVIGKIFEIKKIWLFLCSNQKPVIFDHLPKCGGSSINKFLSDSFPEKYSFKIGKPVLDSVEKFKNIPESKRRKIKLVYGHLANELFDFAHPDSIRVTVFRDPIDRIVSHYYYAKNNKGHYLHQRINIDNIGLDEYCYLNLSHELENWYVTHFSGLNIQEIKMNPAKSIDLAYNKIIEKFHLIGFQNDISSFIEELRNIAKIPNQFKNEVVNITEGRKSIKDIDQFSIKRILNKNDLDVELFEKLYSLRKLNNVIIRT